MARPQRTAQRRICCAGRGPRAFRALRALDVEYEPTPQKVVDALDMEVRKGGLVDEFLQDQLIVFQALAEGKSIIPGTVEAANSDRTHMDKTDEPFGTGSTHTITARWVASQLLPHVQWMDGGRICEGAAWKTSATPGLSEEEPLSAAEEALKEMHVE